MRQNGTNGVTPTRRVVLGGGLAASLWRLTAPARASAADPGTEGLLNFEAAREAVIRPAPGRTGHGLRRCRRDSGSAHPAQARRRVEGAALQKLAELTTLSFAGLRATNAAAGIGGLMQQRLIAGARPDIRLISPDSGFDLSLIRANQFPMGFGAGFELDVAISPSAAEAQRCLRSMAQPSSIGAPKPASVIPRAQPTVFALGKKRRWSRRCACGVTSRGSCTRWTTAGSPIGATPSSSSRAGAPMPRLSPIIPANGRSNRRSPSTAQPAWERGFRWGQ